MNEQSHDNYESIGTYTNSDARVLLDAYEHEKVRFLVAVDDSLLKGMDPVTARFGRYGQGTGVAISVLKEDREKAFRICHNVLKIEV